MGDVEVHFDLQADNKSLRSFHREAMQQAVRDFAAENLDPSTFQKPESLPEDDDTEDAQELRAMVKSHDYWQRKPSAAQANPFEDS
jgi:hypothetical protein